MSRSFVEGKMNIESFVDFCAAQRLDAIDVMDSISYPWCWAGYSGTRSSLARKAASSGLKIAACACGNNFAQTKEDEFAKNISKVESALSEAAELGAPLLRVFGGYHAETGGDKGIDYANGFESILRGIDAVLPLAEKRGVVLALENHGRLPGHAYELLWILQRFNTPSLRVTFDVANFISNSMNELADPLAAFVQLAPYVAHVHVKDFGLPVVDKTRRVEACVAGKGLVPLRQFAAALAESGYQGYCSLEYEAASVCPEAEGVPQSLDYLRRIAAIHRVFRKG